MRIIYEVGDCVWVEDNGDIPGDIYAECVILLEDKGDGNWLVETEDDSKQGVINEEWLNGIGTTCIC